MRLLKKQYWMANEDEFCNIKAKITNVQQLTEKYRNYAYTEKFREECEVLFSYATYILEGEHSDNNEVMRKRISNCMRAIHYLKNIVKDSPLTASHIKSVHEIIMHDEKDVLIGEYRTKSVFAGYTTFAPYSTISRLVNEALNRYFHSCKDPIGRATDLYMDLINTHPFEDGNGRLCRVLLSHVLMQSGCTLFPVILSSFHKRGRRHYIQAVKKYDYNPSMLYTMVAVSIVRAWDNFKIRQELYQKLYQKIGQVVGQELAQELVKNLSLEYGVIPKPDKNCIKFLGKNLGKNLLRTCART